jgi:hypothetical protein
MLKLRIAECMITAVDGCVETFIDPKYAVTIMALTLASHLSIIFML